MCLAQGDGLVCILFIMVISAYIRQNKSNPAPGSNWYDNDVLTTCEEELEASQLLQIRTCFNESKILYGQDFQCYDINKQGPCEKEEMLVLVKNARCGETECVPNPSHGCPSTWVRYNGTCFSPLDPLACGNHTQRGMRIRQTAFGEVKCECARHLGFIQVDGKCYHQYLQGPCNDGDQLIRNGDGYICTENICETKAEFLWRDNNCYPLGEAVINCNDILVQMVKEGVTAEDPEDILVEMVKEGDIAEEHGIEIVCSSQFEPRSIFINCLKYSSTRECLVKGEIPHINLDAQEINDAFRKYLDLSIK